MRRAGERRKGIGIHHISDAIALVVALIASFVFGFLLAFYIYL